MGEIRDDGAAWMRDYFVDNLPVTGPNKPAKAAGRALFGKIEDAISLAGENGSYILRDTKTLLDADLDHDAGTYALVQFDSTDAQNGYYKKSGASGTGSWTFLGADPRVEAAAAAEAARDAAEEFKDDAQGARDEAIAAASAVRAPQGVPVTAMLAQWLFDEGAGSTAVNALNPGTLDIDLNTPTDPNVAWSGKGVLLASGLVQTPSLTGLRTIVSLRRVPRNAGTSGGAAAFVQSGGASAGSGITSAPASVAAGGGELTRVGSGEGVHDLFCKPSTGAGAYELNRGGWIVEFRELDAAYTTIIGFGGRHSATTDRLSEMEIAWVGAYSSQLTDDECDQIYQALRPWAAKRGIYLNAEDCPEVVPTVLLVGDSSMQGRSFASKIAATATASLSSYSATLSSVTGVVLPFAMINGAGIAPGTFIASGPAAGGAGVYALSFPALTTASGVSVTVSPFASDFRNTLIQPASNAAARLSMERFALGENQQVQDLTAVGPETGWALAKRAAYATSPGKLGLVKFAVGSTQLAPPLAQSGSTPAFGSTYNVESGGEPQLGLFGAMLRHWYDAEQAARLRGMGLNLVGVQLSLGLQDAVSTDFAPSDSAYEGYVTDFYNSIVAHTGVEGLKFHLMQSHSGDPASDATALANIRGGQADAVATINTAAGSTVAFLYDTDINVPAAGIYGGVPYGLESDGHILAFGNVKAGQAGFTAFGL